MGAKIEALRRWAEAYIAGIRSLTPDDLAVIERAGIFEGSARGAPVKRFSRVNPTDIGRIDITSNALGKCRVYVDRARGMRVSFMDEDDAMKLVDVLWLLRLRPPSQSLVLATIYVCHRIGLKYSPNTILYSIGDRIVVERNCYEPAIKTELTERVLITLGGRDTVKKVIIDKDVLIGKTKVRVNAPPHILNKAIAVTRKIYEKISVPGVTLQDTTAYYRDKYFLRATARIAGKKFNILAQSTDGEYFDIKISNDKYCLFPINSLNNIRDIISDAESSADLYDVLFVRNTHISKIPVLVKHTVSVLKRVTYVSLPLRNFSTATPLHEEALRKAYEVFRKGKMPCLRFDIIDAIDLYMLAMKHSDIGFRRYITSYLLPVILRDYYSNTVKYRFDSRAKYLKRLVERAQTYNVPEHQAYKLLGILDSIVMENRGRNKNLAPA